MKTLSTVYYGNTGEWTLDGVAARPCHGLFWCYGLTMSRFVSVTVRDSRFVSVTVSSVSEREVRSCYVRRSRSHLQL